MVAKPAVAKNLSRGCALVALAGLRIYYVFGRPFSPNTFCGDVLCIANDMRAMQMGSRPVHPSVIRAVCVSAGMERRRIN